MPPNVVRHDLLVAALIEAGQLAQGIADAERQAEGCDRLSPIQDAAMVLVLAYAQRVGASWLHGFDASIGGLADAIDSLAACDLPTLITVKQPEGFAHYALYPEAYFEAACGLPSDTCVIGLRSIGTSLAAMVAAGAGATMLLTLRPVGHPFRREFALEPALLTAIAGRPARAIAIVDEGPGLSGSSMNGLADLLERAGVPSRRIVFFPSHGGDLGTEAAARHRLRWATADRRIIDFKPLIETRLASAVADLTGPAVGSLEDLSAGRWRNHLYDDPADWPPIHAAHERRKFLLRSASGGWLLKFVGLGSIGASAFERAKHLHKQGFAAQPIGLRLGFLVERWHPDATPLGPRSADRSLVLTRVGRYLGLRAARPAEHAGAGMAGLADMTASNIREAFGESWARVWHLRYGVGHDLPAPRPVETDNRLHRWEWLRLPGGEIIKADGIDHHRAHDLVGCQDVAWDIAGAATEFDCSLAEVERLVAMVEDASGRVVSRDLVRWYGPVYLAFQIGLWTMARTQADDNEAPRIESLLTTYRDALAARLFPVEPSDGPSSWQPSVSLGTRLKVPFPHAEPDAQHPSRSVGQGLESLLPHRVDPRASGE